ncbi:MAG TPA: TonB family protein [Methylophilaceae bacterium]|nr:TonB family protein [Methylophilaceae bacterium]HQR60632.1 TonB family protein [Methylophilaceae bacterium]
MLSPYRAKVLLALLLSLLLHTLIYATWPQLQAVSSMPVLVQGELVAPEIEEPPAPEPPPPQARPEPIPELPAKAREQKEPAPREKPDTGIALPLIAEQADDASTNDYVVPQAPPLEADDKLPFASKTGTVPLEQYVPSSGAGAEPSSGNEEDAVDREVLAEYGRILRDRAAQAGGYPPLAAKRGWQGRVKVLVRFSRYGLPRQIEVKESSGHKVLDERALEMVRQACAEAALPEALNRKAFSVVVPVDFKLM